MFRFSLCAFEYASLKAIYNRYGANALRKGNPILSFRTGNTVTDAGQLFYSRPSCDIKDIRHAKW
jgi:hypothetical protein